MTAQFENRKLNRKLSKKLRLGEHVLWTSENCRATLDLQIFYAIYALIGALVVYLAVFVIPSQLLFDFFRAGSPLSFIYYIWSTGITLFAFGMPAFAFLQSFSFAYAVTSERLLILNTFPPSLCRTMPAEEIQYVKVSSNGTRGSIRLRRPQLVHMFRKYRGHWNILMPRRLMNVTDVESAAMHLRALLEKRDRG